MSSRPGIEHHENVENLKGTEIGQGGSKKITGKNLQIHTLLQ